MKILNRNSRALRVLVITLALLFLLIIKIEQSNYGIELNTDTRSEWNYQLQACRDTNQPLDDPSHYAKNSYHWMKIKDEDISRRMSEWKSFVKTVPRRKPGGGKGIVYTCHSGIAKFALASIRLLRRYGCNLPIEVFHNGDELKTRELDAFNAIEGVKTRDFKTTEGSISIAPPNEDKMFEAKGAALVLSSFEQVLFLDSDVRFD